AVGARQEGRERQGRVQVFSGTGIRAGAGAADPDGLRAPRRRLRPSPPRRVRERESRRKVVRFSVEGPRQSGASAFLDPVPLAPPKSSRRAFAGPLKRIELRAKLRPIRSLSRGGSK